MSSAAFEQRNRYKGSLPRAWVRLRFEAADGTLHEVELLADTGNPFAVILSTADMARLRRRHGPGTQTNFGFLAGGWLELDMPEFGLKQAVIGYASDVVAQATQSDHPSFQGLAGLPLLRLVEYGGDADAFWLRKPTPKATGPTGGTASSTTDPNLPT